MKTMERPADAVEFAALIYESEIDDALAARCEERQREQEVVGDECCRKCRTKIPAARRKALPFATLCVKCAR